MLTNKEYLKLEDEFVARYYAKMLTGHASNEASLRQALGDILEKYELIPKFGKSIICNPKAIVKIEYED